MPFARCLRLSSLTFTSALHFTAAAAAVRAACDGYLQRLPHGSDCPGAVDVQAHGRQNGSIPVCMYLCKSRSCSAAAAVAASNTTAVFLAGGGSTINVVSLQKRVLMLLCGVHAAGEEILRSMIMYVHLQYGYSSKTSSAPLIPPTHMICSPHDTYTTYTAVVHTEQERGSVILLLGSLLCSGVCRFD